jgi:hypothetical protein
MGQVGAARKRRADPAHFSGLSPFSHFSLIFR